MLNPIKCFTCGKLLANKYNYYQNELLKKKMASKEGEDDEETTGGSNLILDLSVEDIKKTHAGEIMDELGLTRICCRKSMLSHINLIDEI